MDNPEIWKKNGNDYFSQGDFESAAKCYSHAIELDPDHISSWNNLGLALLKLGKVDEARECNKRVKELKQNTIPSKTSVLISNPYQNKTPNLLSSADFDDIKKKYEDGIITYDQYQNYVKQFKPDIKPESKQSEGKSQAQDPVQEYRRTCQQCGTVWHSLVGRELHLQNESKWGTCLMCTNVFNNDAFAQWNRNKESSDSELSRLRKCPKCGSINYVEEILTHTN